MSKRKIRVACHFRLRGNDGTPKSRFDKALAQSLLQQRHERKSIHVEPPQRRNSTNELPLCYRRPGSHSTKAAANLLISGLSCLTLDLFA
jgi:hypothetical protein